METPAVDKYFPGNKYERAALNAGAFRKPDCQKYSQLLSEFRYTTSVGGIKTPVKGLNIKSEVTVKTVIDARCANLSALIRSGSVIGSSKAAEPAAASIKIYKPLFPGSQRKCSLNPRASLSYLPQHDGDLGIICDNTNDRNTLVNAQQFDDCGYLVSGLFSNRCHSQDPQMQTEDVSMRNRTKKMGSPPVSVGKSRLNLYLATKCGKILEPSSDLPKKQIQSRADADRQVFQPIRTKISRRVEIEKHPSVVAGFDSRKRVCDLGENFQQESSFASFSPSPILPTKHIAKPELTDNSEEHRLDTVLDLAKLLEQSPPFIFRGQ